MKKFLILALIILVAYTVMLFLPKRSASKVYPWDTVNTVFYDSAAVLGGSVDAQYWESPHNRGVQHMRRVGMWIRGLVGKSDPEGKTETFITIGSNKFTIACLLQNENVFQLQIQPAPSASTQSADLKREILKKLPGLDFMP